MLGIKAAERRQNSVVRIKMGEISGRNSGRHLIISDKEDACHLLYASFSQIGLVKSLICSKCKGEMAN